MLDKRYIIIAGATRSGSTSLFNHLSKHRHICASKIKETGFFLDDDYPNRPVRNYYYKDGLEKFYEYFSKCSDTVYRMEATPGYLYSLGTAERIKQSLPFVKIVFLLRNPIHRLISTYRFNKQTGRLPSHISLESYIEIQLSNRNPGYHRSLQTGKYSKYLRKYFEVFNPNQVKVFGFSVLARDSREMLDRLYEFSGLPQQNGLPNQIKRRNQSYEIKNEIIHTTFTSIKPIFLNVNRRLAINDRRITKWVGRLVDKTYQVINLKGNIENPIDAQTLVFLEEYYSNEKDEIIQIIGDNQFDW
jgi:hypothetical protein